MRLDPQEVSREQFSEWKQNPVTLNLFTELYAAVFDQFDDRLPLSVDEGTARAYKRDGAAEILDTMWKWEPSHLMEEEE